MVAGILLGVAAGFLVYAAFIEFVLNLLFNGASWVGNFIFPTSDSGVFTFDLDTLRGSGLNKIFDTGNFYDDLKVIGFTLMILITIVAAYKIIKRTLAGESSESYVSLLISVVVTVFIFYNWETFYTYIYNNAFSKVITGLLERLQNTGPTGSALRTATLDVSPFDFKYVLVALMIGYFYCTAICQAGLYFVERWVNFAVTIFIAPLVIPFNIDKDTRGVFKSWYSALFTQMLGIVLNLIFLIAYNVMLMNTPEYLLSSLFRSDSTDQKQIIPVLFAIIFLRLAGNSEKILNMLGLKTMSFGEVAQAIGGNIGKAFSTFKSAITAGATVAAGGIAGAVGANMAGATGWKNAQAIKASALQTAKTTAGVVGGPNMRHALNASGSVSQAMGGSALGTTKGEGITGVRNGEDMSVRDKNAIKKAVSDNRLTMQQKQAISGASEKVAKEAENKIANGAIEGANKWSDAKKNKHIAQESANAALNEAGRQYANHLTPQQMERIKNAKDPQKEAASQLKQLNGQLNEAHNGTQIQKMASGMVQAVNERSKAIASTNETIDSNTRQIYKPEQISNLNKAMGMTANPETGEYITGLGNAVYRGQDGQTHTMPVLQVQAFDEGGHFYDSSENSKAVGIARDNATGKTVAFSNRREDLENLNFSVNEVGWLGVTKEGHTEGNLATIACSKPETIKENTGGLFTVELEQPANLGTMKADSVAEAIDLFYNNHSEKDDNKRLDSASVQKSIKEKQTFYNFKENEQKVYERQKQRVEKSTVESTDDESKPVGDNERLNANQPPTQI